jgi:outer membrane receptor protein involved in Fe transport
MSMMGPGFLMAALVLALPFFLANEGLAQTPQEEVFGLDQVVVTATRTEQKLKDVAAAVTVITKEEIKRSAAQTIDDLLRQIPFVNFSRRSSSMVANPTAQGVSLRGIGPSATSRSLVLLDGVPLNDPFGGWVYWSKVPLQSVERIEVVRGGGSAVWGNLALAGVINIITEKPQKRTIRFTGEGGSQGTVNLDLYASDLVGPVGLAVEGNYFKTDGYKVVREDQRGAIDINADSEHKLFSGKLEYSLSPTAALYLHGSAFTEDRSNGTPLTHNATDAGYVGGGINFKTADGSDWKFAAFSNLQTLTSTFSSTGPGRNSETPSIDQFAVPSTAVGAALQWSKQVHERHLVAAGTDFRWISGESDEDFAFNSTLGRFTRRREAGGEQQLTGMYLQDIITLDPQWQLTIAGRLDLWQSLNGFRTEQTLPVGVITLDRSFPDRDRVAFNPRVGLLYRATDRLSLRGSFYRGFRTPTFDELYRLSQVRNDVVEANDRLDPEQLIGGETGFDYAFASNLLGRVTGFWNEVEGLIINTTVGTGPGTIPPCGPVPAGAVCRQRQNVDRSRFRGIELELEFRPHPYWTLSGSYLFNDAEVLSAPNQPDLEGKRIARTARHQFTLRADYANPSVLNVSVQGRYIGDQFDDDLNLQKLDGFFVVDLQLSRQIKPGWEAFLGVENLFDRTYEVAKSAGGTVTIGAPILAHGGIRARF